MNNRAAGISVRNLGAWLCHAKTCRGLTQRAKTLYSPLMDFGYLMLRLVSKSVDLSTSRDLSWRERTKVNSQDSIDIGPVIKARFKLQRAKQCCLCEALFEIAVGVPCSPNGRFPSSLPSLLLIKQG